MPNQTEALDRVFQALADPSRRAMIERLTRGPASVSELAKPLQMSLPAVVQHLQMLEQSGLVNSRKAGRVRTCHIAPRRLEAAQAWLVDQRAQWNARFDRMDALLENGDVENGDPEK